MATLRTFLKTFEAIIYVERYSTSNGLLHKIDPGVKLCCVAGFIVSAISVRTVAPLILLLVAVTALSVASRIPLKFFLLRSVIFVPVFAAVIALPLPFLTPGAPLAQIRYDGLVATITAEGTYRAAQFTLRVLVCVASLILLVLTTRTSELFHVMEGFRVPRVFVTMTSLTYRFIFLFINEAYRMALARESRTITGMRWLEALRSLANMVSTLFIRAYERGERVYLAMNARAYAGSFESPGGISIAPRDWFFAAASFAVSLAALSVEYLRLGC